MNLDLLLLPINHGKTSRKEVLFSGLDHGPGKRIRFRALGTLLLRAVSMENGRFD